MPIFRKKPVEIEARHFSTDGDKNYSTMNKLVKWINKNGGSAFHDRSSIFIETLEGEMRAECFDWIIKGVQGEFYPCKPEIFKATYEPVGDESKEQ